MIPSSAAGRTPTRRGDPRGDRRIGHRAVVGAIHDKRVARRFLLNLHKLRLLQAVGDQHRAVHRDVAGQQRRHEALPLGLRERVAGEQLGTAWSSTGCCGPAGSAGGARRRLGAGEPRPVWVFSPFMRLPSRMRKSSWSRHNPRPASVRNLDTGVCPTYNNPVTVGPMLFVGEPGPSCPSCQSPNTEILSVRHSNDPLCYCLGCTHFFRPPSPWHPTLTSDEGRQSTPG